MVLEGVVLMISFDAFWRWGFVFSSLSRLTQIEDEYCKPF